jgi:hypothetical protein
MPLSNMEEMLIVLKEIDEIVKRNIFLENKIVK